MTLKSFFLHSSVQSQKTSFLFCFVFLTKNLSFSFFASSWFSLLINSNCPIKRNLLCNHTLWLDGDRTESTGAPVSKPALIENDGTFVPLNGTHLLVWSHKRKSCFQCIQWSQRFPSWLCSHDFPWPLALLVIRREFQLFCGICVGRESVLAVLPQQTKDQGGGPLQSEDEYAASFFFWVLENKEIN